LKLEQYTGVAVTVGVAVSVAVDVAVGVTVSVAVDVAVGVGVGVTVGRPVNVAVTVGVGVGVAVEKSVSGAGTQLPDDAGAVALQKVGVQRVQTPKLQSASTSHAFPTPKVAHVPTFVPMQSFSAEHNLPAPQSSLVSQHL